jgi:hypothetical protein
MAMGEYFGTELLLGWMVGKRISGQRTGKVTEPPIPVYHNISQVAGKALVSRGGDGIEICTEYGVGQMPLLFTTYIEGSIGYGTLTKGNNLNDVYFCPEARAGDFLEFYLTFPEYSCDYAEADGLLNQWIYICGILPEGAKYQPMTQMGKSQYSTAWQINNEATTLRDRQMGDDFVCELIQDEAGTVTGLHCSGTLLHDLAWIYFNGTLNYELPIYDDQGHTNVAKGNNLTRFASYDDFRWRVVKGGA